MPGFASVINHLMNCSLCIINDDINTLYTEYRDNSLSDAEAANYQNIISLEVSYAHS